MQNELRKVFLISWHYKFNLCNELLTLAINFFGMIFLMYASGNTQTELGAELIGYIIWVYASYLFNASHALTLEGRSGTLDQLYLSPAPPLLIITCALLATLVSTTCMVVAMSLFVYFVSGIAVPLNLSLIPILACTLIGLLGIGLIISGTALIYKNVAGLEYLLTSSLLYLNGSMISIEHLPHWLQKVALQLPTTQGIIILRSLLNQQQSTISVMQSNSFLLLASNSLLYIVLGVVLFMLCNSYAQKSGCIGTY